MSSCEDSFETRHLVIIYKEIPRTMKKIVGMMLGLSLVMGVAAFAQETTATTTTKTHKMKKTGKSKTHKSTTETTATTK